MVHWRRFTRLFDQEHQVPRALADSISGGRMNCRALFHAGGAGLAAALATLSFAASALAQGTSCRAADSLSARTTRELKDYVTSTDSFTVRVRNSLGITGTSANKISYNTNSTTCKSAVTALNNHSGTPGRVRTVYVWAVGSNYAVEDPTDESAGFPRAV